MRKLVFMHKQSLPKATANGHKTTKHAQDRESKIVTRYHNMVAELCFPGANCAHERTSANRFLHSFMKSDEKEASTSSTRPDHQIHASAQETVGSDPGGGDPSVLDANYPPN